MEITGDEEILCAYNISLNLSGVSEVRIAKLKKRISNIKLRIPGDVIKRKQELNGTTDNPVMENKIHNGNLIV